MTIIVALDGPAGAGKSTVARAVAAALGLEVLDTGAMYRAVTYAVLKAGVLLEDGRAATEIAEATEIEVAERVTVDGVDATDAIRGPEVSAAVSIVSAHPGVREQMVARQRAWAEAHGGGVIEGRDIGTVVFPDAPVKVFLTADPAVRASRRQGDEAAAARSVDVAVVRADLDRRDHLDSTRAVAPLQSAPGALVVDTTDMTVEDVVAAILASVDRAGLAS